MSDFNRPVYVKKKNRKRQRTERLHGAFTGGFSAGHFNTVGSKSGWKPSNFEEVETEEDNDGNEEGFFSSNLSSSSSASKCRRRRLMQRPEDFMDEEDANEWGGPMKVNQSFQTNIAQSNNIGVKNTANDEKSIKDSSSLRKLLHANKKSSTSKRDSVGKQLLKVLGWREHIKENDSKSYAYVSLDKDEKTLDGSLLSSKRLKRIEMQLSSRKHEVIPAPKTDTYGMGYEPYKNAPEFKAHREMRKQRAQQRARAAASSTGDKRMNVYSIDDLNDDCDDDTGPVTKVSQKKNEHKDVLAYETMEDFIGTQTVGGFALHDDDDQVYDTSVGHSASLFNKGEKSKINLGDYHNEAYEGSDSDVEEGDYLLNQFDRNKKIQKALKHNEKGTSRMNAFAGALNAWASEGKENVNIKAVTSDGEALLDGFDLGGSNSDTMKRHPGPEVPANYEVKRHHFSHEDAISTLKELSSMKREAIETKRAEKERSNEPIAGKAFASLSSALKNRFTKSTKTEDKLTNSRAEINPRNVKVSRTTKSWQPSHLLLKRFNVSSTFTKNDQNAQTTNAKALGLSKEENFFQKDVLGQLKLPSNFNNDQNSALGNNTLAAEKIDTERPSYELMKSIFEPSSDEDDLEEEITNNFTEHNGSDDKKIGNDVEPTDVHDVQITSSSKKKRKKSSSKFEKMKKKLKKQKKKSKD